MWSHAPNLTARHGFSDRLGGVSQGVYAALNLSQNVGDEETAVQENRLRALQALGIQDLRLARLRQVHSSEVVTVTRDSDPERLPMADGMVTKLHGVALVIESADCYPVLLEDATAGVIAAAHCGWRGTAGQILANVVEAMLAQGARPERIRAALGPGISGAQYAVGADVLARFAGAGFPESAYLERPGGPSRSGIEQFFVNLRRANTWVLSEAGVSEDQIWASAQSSTDEAFFSHRRDHGQTGRMWSVIAKTER